MSSSAQPLFILAFDHRAVLRALYPGVEESQYRDSKMMLLDAITQVAEAGTTGCGYLVDEEYGAGAARETKSRGIVLAMPVEASRTAEMEFQYGDAMAEHIQQFAPDLVKTLIFHSVGDSPDRKSRQLEKLALLAKWCADNGYPLMLELLIASLVAQPAPYAHDKVLADALCESILELQQLGQEPAIWKIDGLDSPDQTARVAHQAGLQAFGGQCIVLGSGASLENVGMWLGNAARVDGYSGFAVGRSVWTGPLGAFFEGSLTREAAINQVAQHFSNLVRIYCDGAADRP